MILFKKDNSFKITEVVSSNEEDIDFILLPTPSFYKGSTFTIINEKQLKYTKNLKMIVNLIYTSEDDILPGEKSILEIKPKTISEVYSLYPMIMQLFIMQYETDCFESHWAYMPYIDSITLYSGSTKLFKWNDKNDKKNDVLFEIFEEFGLKNKVRHKFHNRSIIMKDGKYEIIKLNSIEETYKLNFDIIILEIQSLAEEVYAFTRDQLLFLNEMKFTIAVYDRENSSNILWTQDEDLVDGDEIYSYESYTIHKKLEALYNYSTFIRFYSKFKEEDILVKLTIEARDFNTTKTIEILNSNEGNVFSLYNEIFSVYNNNIFNYK